jgi:uncharacterized protein YijF (DUF1287 family)
MFRYLRYILIGPRLKLAPALSIFGFLLLFFWASQSAHGQSHFYRRLADSALVLTQQQVVYDPAYYAIEFPNGDVPPGKGVCTDVVIRAYRMLGIDLQKEVHEDMRAHFSKYPQLWGLAQPDKNIDHRRVPNLMTFFARHGTTKPITHNPADYVPGDIVCWDLGSGITHIGIVSNQTAHNSTRPLIVHNIGAGQVLEDILFSYQIIGHYRYGE